MKLDYHQQLQRQITAIRKRMKLHIHSRGKINPDDELAMRYYQQCMKSSACVSFETFKNSWAGSLWIKKQGK